MHWDGILITFCLFNWGRFHFYKSYITLRFFFLGRNRQILPTNMVQKMISLFQKGKKKTLLRRIVVLVSGIFYTPVALASGSPATLKFLGTTLIFTASSGKVDGGWGPPTSKKVFNTEQYPQTTSTVRFVPEL